MFPQRLSELFRAPETYKPPPDRELSGNVEYPNLNVKDLNARPENLAPRLHDCWDSIAVSEHNHFALATNRREGGQWWGMFFGCGRSQLNHLAVDNADFRLQAEHTVNIVRYAERNVLLVALGDTRLQVWSTYAKVRSPQTPYCLFLLGESPAHPTPISQLSVCRADRQRAVSGSPDGTLNVWDYSGADLVSSYHTRCAHTDKMTALATPSASHDQFVTCDRGGCARLWDVRAAAPSSTCLYADSSRLLSFTSAAWASPTELQGDNYVYIGDYDGMVHTLDIRVPRKLAESREYFDQGHVSQLLINGPLLAAMSNSPASVKVADVQADQEFIYSHRDTHTRLTDAVWTGDSTLITIGYGRKMVSHAIK
ncbi:protein valois-like [Drosophila biarmipes]|uniref:protein valois-like n=1 Tax=Drosophila biarmipes TaxID=125945 RepID=UPI0007E8542F|nr:protein valois-like [Drosophila biarmipes]